ncbi:unnamed protein product [Penicillium salamii]|nr:unnamed protein product [Penicillium salamii]
MGITESKILQVKLAAACSDAEDNGRNQVLHVLSDKQFIDCLTTIWRNLPDRSKKQINPISRIRPKHPQKAEKGSIRLPEPLKKNLIQWQGDHTSFWNIQRAHSPSESCHITAIYHELTKMEIQNSGDMVRMRFLKVFFHHLKVRFCATNLGLDAVEWMTRKVILAGAYQAEKDEISAKIRAWALVGSRYDSLCRDIGEYNVAQDYTYLGTLIRLPEEFTDRYMLKELRVKGRDREDVLDSLARRGVGKVDHVAEMDRLANDIFLKLWESIDSSTTDEAPHGGMFVSLKDWRILQSTRVIKLQNKVPQATQRPDHETNINHASSTSTIPTPASESVIREGASDCQDVGISRSMSMIDSRTADCTMTASATSHSDNTSQVHPVDSDYLDTMNVMPHMENASRIHPMDAVYPDTMHVMPHMDNTSRIHPMDAVYPDTMHVMPHMDNTSRIHPMDAMYPDTMNVMPHMNTASRIHPMDAMYPDTMNVMPHMDTASRIHPMDAVYPDTMDVMPHMNTASRIHPMDAVYPDTMNVMPHMNTASRIHPMDAVYPDTMNVMPHMNTASRIHPIHPMDAVYPDTMNVMPHMNTASRIHPTDADYTMGGAPHGGRGQIYDGCVVNTSICT